MNTCTKYYLIIVVCYGTLFSVKAQINNHHKSYIDIGYVGGVQNSTSAIAGVYCAFGTFYKVLGRLSSIDIKSREVYISQWE